MKKAIVILILLGGAGFGAWRLLAEPAQAEQRTKATAVARKGSLVEVASATGTVEPDVMVEIKPRASGEVVAVLAEEGQTVAEGDVLLRLDPTEREESLREAKAAVEQARAKLAEAEATQSVAQAEAKEAKAYAAVRRKGVKRGLVSKEDLRVADSAARVKRANVTLRAAQIEAAKASLAAAELRVETAQRLLEEMTVRAPIGATVLGVEVEVGSVVASGITNVGGGTAVLTLADLSRLLVVGQLDEAQVGKVEAGQDVTVRVDAWPNRTFTGTVARVSPLGEEQSSVVTFDMDVVVSDAEADLLKPGMSADIEVVVGRHEDTVLVPISALRSRGSRRFVVRQDGEWLPVRTGATDGTDIVILKGLEVGDEFLTGAAASKASEQRSGPRGPFGMGGPGGGRGGGPGGGRP